MVDILSPEARSALMASVRSVGTAPEMRVRRIAWKSGLRYRIAPKTLDGRPDLVFPAARLVVFVHGCFWHGHEGCRKAKLPVSNRVFWEDKIRSNQERDARAQDRLIADGWEPIVIWECETKSLQLILQRLAPVFAHYQSK